MSLPANEETPPRTWGRPFSSSDSSRTKGNTPTHVGKTQKHLPKKKKAQETPPRTWGRLSGQPGKAATIGNTPTHVGKTIGTCIAGMYKRKHPHARGEDCFEVLAVIVSKETPPRTWGRLFVGGCGFTKVGNTPTHVGKTNCTI